jgi:predicted esterase
MNVTKPADHALHQGGLVRTAGESLETARSAMLMVHGRGAQAEDILSLAGQMNIKGVAYLAPQATGNTWYPNRFLAPLSENEPWLSSALSFLDDVYARITTASIPPECVVVLGFSQGACLALEYAARHAHRYGALVGLSGALIGPDATPRDYDGSLAGTPILYKATPRFSGRGCLLSSFWITSTTSYALFH